MRDELIHHERDATLMAAQEADKHDAEAKAKAEAVNRNWSNDHPEIRSQDPWADTTQARIDNLKSRIAADEARANKLRAEIAETKRFNAHLHEVMSEPLRHTVESSRFPQTRAAWEKWQREYQKESKRLAKAARIRRGER